MPLKGTTASGKAVYSFEGGLQTEVFKDKRLIKNKGSDNYQVITYLQGNPETGKDPSTKEVQARGWYDFVVVPGMTDVCWVRLERWERAAKYGAKNADHPDPGDKRGHSAIAQGGDVLFAGSILFGGSYIAKEGKPGDLIRWENKSGHYKCGGQFKVNWKIYGTGKEDPGLAELLKHVKYQTQWLKGGDGNPLLPMEKFEPWYPEI